jgi:hypothetical protein
MVSLTLDQQVKWLSSASAVIHVALSIRGSW